MSITVFNKIVAIFFIILVSFDGVYYYRSNVRILHAIVKKQEKSNHQIFYFIFFIMWELTQGMKYGMLDET